MRGEPVFQFRFMEPATKRKLRRFALVVIAAATLSAIALCQPGRAQAFETPLDLLMKQARAAEASPASAGRRERSPRAARATSSRVGSAWPTVAAAAQRHGVPLDLAKSVCIQETGCRFGLVGAAGEKGPMQIKPATARMLGYSGPARALLGATGAEWGVIHLARAYRRCGSYSGAAKLHNAGLGASCRANGYARAVARRAEAL